MHTAVTPDVLLTVTSLVTGTECGHVDTPVFE